MEIISRRAVTNSSHSTADYCYFLYQNSESIQSLPAASIRNIFISVYKRSMSDSIQEHGVSLYTISVPEAIQTVVLDAIQNLSNVMKNIFRQKLYNITFAPEAIDTLYTRIYAKPQCKNLYRHSVSLFLCTRRG